MVTLSSNVVQDHSIPASALNSNLIKFDILLPEHVLMQRELYVSYDLQLSIQSPTAGAEILPKLTEFSLAANPLARASSRVTVTLNRNHALTYESALVNNALAHYRDIKHESACRTRLDPMNNVYAMGRANVALGGTPADMDANTMIVNSPFQRGGYAIGDIGTINPIDITRTGGDSDWGNIFYRVRERISHPFLTGSATSDTVDVLSGITSMEITIEIGGLAGTCLVARVVDPTVVNVPRNVNVSFAPDSKPSLEYRTFQPVSRLPRVLSMPYNDMKLLRFPALAGAAPGDLGSFDTKLVSLHTVPDRLYIFVRPDADLTTTTQADAYGAIKSLWMLTDYSSALLKDCSQAQLYQIARRAGSQQTWTGFSDWQGSVFCLDLTASDVPGVITQQSGNFTFTLSGTFQNTTWSGWDATTGLRTGNTGSVGAWELVLVAETGGRLVCSDGQLYTDVGVSDGLIVKMIKKMRK